jgi:hypothetical protein
MDEDRPRPFAEDSPEGGRLTSRWDCTKQLTKRAFAAWLFCFLSSVQGRPDDTLRTTMDEIACSPRIRTGTTVSVRATVADPGRGDSALTGAPARRVGYVVEVDFESLRLSAACPGAHSSDMVFLSGDSVILPLCPTDSTFWCRSSHPGLPPCAAYPVGTVCAVVAVVREREQHSGALDLPCPYRRLLYLEPLSLQAIKHIEWRPPAQMRVAPPPAEIPAPKRP